MPGFSSLSVVVDFQELERRARAPALGTGPLHVGIIDVLVDPGLVGLVLLVAFYLAAQATILP
jgi:hypothetical protein